MHVGLNLAFWVPGETGGMETYARSLIPELVAAAPGDRFSVLLSRAAAAGEHPWLHGVARIALDHDPRSRVQWVLAEQRRVPPAARRAGVDVLHSFASTAPLWGSFRRVVTIHDLIYRTLPDAHPGVRALGMRALVPLAARTSARIIVPSHATAADVTRHLRIAPARIDVVHHGVGAVTRVAPLGESELRARIDAGRRPIVLSVSAKLAHKNLVRLLDALARIDPGARPLLVLPGYATPHESELRAHAARAGVADDVRFLGWVPAEELEGLYAAAAGVVFPSLAEGFGLPVLEAMARGVPVACSDIAVLREVGGDAAMYFDPHEPAQIAGAITALTGDAELRARLAAAGRARAAGFSWRAAGEATLASYRAALSAS